MHLLNSVVIVGVLWFAHGVKSQLNYSPTETYRCPGVNEEYTTCGSACPPTCETIVQNDLICIALCVPGCICKAGHVRNRWNNCIPKEKCPCKNPNEIFACGSACQTTCATLGQECPIKNKKCNDTCYCRDGYARDKNGICIPTTDCHNQKR